MKTSSVLIVSFLSLVVSGAFAQVRTFEIMNNPVEQGGTVAVRIFPHWREPLACLYAFGLYHVPDKSGYVHIGVGASETVARHNIYRVECGRGIRLDGGYYDEIDVRKKDFQKTRIAGGGPSSRPRKAWERRAISRAFNFDNGLLDDMTSDIRYIKPVSMNAAVIDPFGLIYRNSGTLLHSGTDLRMPVGTKVKAVNYGQVVLVADDYSKEGNMVIMGHGRGIFSVYMHLSRIDVKQGAYLGRGQIIGLSGDTGAGVREPHLHFSIKANGVYVDPFEFIDTVNKNR